MKKLAMAAVLGLVGLWLVSGVAFAEEWKGKSETKTAGSYQVELITPADGSRIGDNNVAVQIKETPSGQAVVRDALRVDFLMDEGDMSMSHGGMSDQKPVVVDLKAVAGAPGRYEGKANLGYSGDWKVRVYTDPRGIQTPATFKLHVNAGGPNFGVIGGVIAAVAIVAGGAVFMIRRSVSAQVATPATEGSEA